MADESSLQNSSIVPCGKDPPLPTTLELRTLLHWRDLLFARPVGAACAVIYIANVVPLL
jgi:hypothetical protein